MSERPRHRQSAYRESDQQGKAWVLAGKFGPPRQRIATSVRYGLLERLDRSLDLPLTVITAPAGFGKSTLLAQWYQRVVEEGEAHVAWLTLDEDDGEISRFVAYLALAVDAAGIDIGPLLQTVQAQLHDIDARSAIASLIARIRAAARPRLIFILDDYDRVASKEVDDLVLDLIQHADPRLHVVLSGRKMPALPLSGLVVRGLVERIDAGDMALGLDDAMQIFDGRLSPEAVQRVHAYTEGWAVALQLAALWVGSNGGGQAESQLLKGFSSNSRGIASYLTEQVVNRLDDDLREFVLKTAILDRFDASLANAVCGRIDGALQLERLGAFFGLVIPLDAEQEWFRYHHLFAEYLQMQLWRLWPGQVPDLHRRAAAWLFERGDLLEAVKHAIRAGDAAMAGEFISDSGGWELVLEKGLGYVRPLLRHFETATIRDTPVLNVTQAYLHIKLGQFRQAQQLLERYRGFPEDQRLSYWTGFFTVQSLLDDYLDETWTDLRRVAQIEAQIPSVGDALLAKSTLHCVCAVGELGRGDFDAAVQHSLTARDGMRDAGNTIGTAYAMFHLGQSHFYSGRLNEAEAIYRESLLVADEYFGVDSALKACGGCLLAQVMCWRGEVRQAGNLVDAGLPFLEGHDGWLDVFAAAYETKFTAVRIGQGAHDALVLLAHVEQMAAERRLRRLGDLARAWRLEALLDLPDAREADMLVIDGGLEVELEHALAHRHYWRQQIALGFALVRWHVRSGRTAPAIVLLGKLEEACAEHGIALHVARAQAQIALLHQQRGDVDRAVAALGQALDYVVRENAWQVLLGLGRQARTLFHLAQQRDPVARAGSPRSRALLRLLDAFGDGDAAGEGFSPREKEILVEICQGRSNKQVARVLNISENTVKFHLKSIFRKLGVDTRSAAVAVAHKRGLFGQ